MPSIDVSDAPPSPPTESIKKSKHKKSKIAELPPPPPETPDPEIPDSGLKKKKKKRSKVESDDGEIVETAEAPSEKKSRKKKKRKASDDEERSDTVSDAEESAEVEAKVKPLEAKAPEPNGNGPLLKKQKVCEKDDEDGDVTGSGEEDAVANPNAVSNFRISEVLRKTLKSKGIEALFPIQAMTYNIIVDGSDLVGRARTGQGKTLAFVLPILESLINGRFKESRRTGHGRTPSVLVLLPTRELANQVHAEFEVYGGAAGLASCCLYGGSPYRSQEMALRRGVDIVVGTPGRIKDHIERHTLDLKNLKFRVLDEADEMLNMGFVDDVELILGKVEDVTKVQTLLFSATLPEWVKKISTRFLKPDKKIADLVGNEKMKASNSVRHLALPCSRQARAQLIPDIIRCYSRGGRTIIFTETKESASELAGLLPGARALHGDIMQAQREVILAGFRSGRFLTLVATNVAARGLDINDVQLIIQCEPPRDVEAYIHRSGRTGRAGNTGVAILLYEPRFSHGISKIERESGFKFEHISAPQPADVAESAGSEAASAISDVSDSVIPVFRPQAEQLLNSSGMPAVDLLAKALAKAAGYTDIKKRSLLSSMENCVTLLLQTGRSIYTPSLAFSTLRRFLPDEKIEGVKGLSLTADGMGAVFDVPADDVNVFLEGQENASMVTLEVLDKLPPLQNKEDTRGNSSGRGRFGRGGGSRFSGGRGGSGGSGGRFSGRGGGRGGGGRFSRRN